MGASARERLEQILALLEISLIIQAPAALKTITVNRFLFTWRSGISICTYFGYYFASPVCSSNNSRRRPYTAVQTTPYTSLPFSNTTTTLTNHQLECPFRTTISRDLHLHLHPNSSDAPFQAEPPRLSSARPPALP